ncbi:YchJ family protein [Myxosarcina sp. GI1(2024)]
MSPKVCPCGSNLQYPNCCQIYLSGKATAPTAERLMRSRYTAFYKSNIEYLIATLHPSKRKFDDRLKLSHSAKNTTWLNLKIIDTSQGQPAAEIGFVEFVAVYLVREPQQLHERSRFIKEGDLWLYLDGVLLPPIIPKRNEPCWCGSGKKYKKCHGV